MQVLTTREGACCHAMARKFAHPGVREGGKNTESLSSAASIGHEVWKLGYGRGPGCDDAITGNDFQCNTSLDPLQDQSGTRWITKQSPARAQTGHVVRGCLWSVSHYRRET